MLAYHRAMSAARDPVPTPSHAHVADLPGGGVRITLDWNRPRWRRRIVRVASVLLALVAALGFVAWALGEVDGRGFLWILATGGGGVALVACALLTAKTRIDVDADAVRVRHRRTLFPWRADHDAGELVQFFCLRTRRRGPGRYHLAAVDREGGKRIVVPHLDHLRDARFLEQRIEARLAIVDHPVRGEAEEPVAPEGTSATFAPRTRWGLGIVSFKASSSGGRFKPGRWDELMFRWRGSE